MIFLLTNNSQSILSVTKGEQVNKGSNLFLMGDYLKVINNNNNNIIIIINYNIVIIFIVIIRVV